MNVKQVTPVLNVSDILKSFLWFEKLGWKKAWDWGEPPSFGAVCAGDGLIFLCQNAQGGRGRGNSARTFGPDGDPNTKSSLELSFRLQADGRL